MHNMSESNFESSSYPPLFRHTSSPTHCVDSDEPTKQVPDSDPLPVIYLQSINQVKLSEACRFWGIFRLVNHGIPMTLLNQLHDHTIKLFNLTFEAKQGLFRSPIAYFWGTPALTPAGVALQRGPQAQYFNWVEGFNVPLSQLPQLEGEENEDPLLRSFIFLLEEYGNHQSRIGSTIFEAMAENLKMCREQSKYYLSPSTGLLRIYRYPRCPLDHNQLARGMDVHTDSSVLSILNQDEVGGLQIYKDNVWLDVKPISNTLVVNLGDMMQAVSNDNYMNVKHRVKVNKHKERISIGYFVFPAENCVIRSSKYKPFTYADFRAQVQLDLKTIGFKAGLQRFKLDEPCQVQRKLDNMS